MSNRRRLGVALLAVIGAAVLVVGCANPPSSTDETRSASSVLTSSPPASDQASCTPTVPNGKSPPGEQPSPESLGNGKLFTYLWPDGVVTFEPGGPGEVRDDGSLAMKWPFWRGEGVSGELTVEVRSLHRPGLSMSAEVPDGYGETGVQPTALVFPEPGCWQVTARADGASLTFVTRVESRY